MRVFVKMKNSKQNQKNGSRDQTGFTLVELMVSIAVFSLVMGVIMQLFFYSMRSHRIILAKSQMIGEMSYNLEHISRGLRMAKKSQVDTTWCLPAGTNFQKYDLNSDGIFDSIKFLNVNQDGTFRCVEYYLGVFEGASALMERQVINSGGVFDLPITSPAINVLEFAIAEYGWGQNDRLQPRATIHIKIQGKENQVLENQITISQRDLDIQE